MDKAACCVAAAADARRRCRRPPTRPRPRHLPPLPPSSLSFLPGSVPSTVDIVVAPTFVHLERVQRTLKGPFQIGAQDCWVSKGGAFTGEVSAEMLHDMGIPWVILGHSGESLRASAQGRGAAV